MQARFRRRRLRMGDRARGHAGRAASRTAAAAVSISRAMTTRSSSTARSRATTMRRRRATASRPARSWRSATWPASSRYVEAARRTVALFAPAHRRNRRAAIRRCSRRAAALESPPAQVLLQGDPATCAQWRRALERPLPAGRADRRLPGVGVDLPRRARQGHAGADRCHRLGVPAHDLPAAAARPRGRGGGARVNACRRQPVVEVPRQVVEVAVR